MALVRCPTHKIPFNDENPRGCPACAREKEGKGRPSLMQELAKAHRVEKPEPRVGPAKQKPAKPVHPAAPPHHPAYRHPAVTASQPVPAIAEGPSKRIFGRINDPKFRKYYAGAVVILVIAAFLSSRPQYYQSMYPAAPSGTPRALPLFPNAPVTSAFSLLGNRAPKANPDSDRLARYTYGTDMTVDALNGVIYAITVKVPNRSWRGLHAGMPERTAQGSLALLGTPSEIGPSSVPEPDQIGNYYVYPSLEQRPRRTISIQVRPPNGCYDAQIELQPQAVGTLKDGDQRYAVIGIDNAALNWVVTQVRVVSRSMRGPYASIPEC